MRAEWMSKLSQNEQIVELNNEVKCTLAPSTIDGIGVFALRNIQRGERCYCVPNLIPKFYNIPFASLNKLFPEVKELVLQRWASVVNGSIFQSPNDDAGLLFFMNHSDNPNYDVVSDTALRDIQRGEEILEDYCFMQNAEKAYKWLICPNVTNVELKKSQTNLSVVGHARRLITNFVKN